MGSEEIRMPAAWKAASLSTNSPRYGHENHAANSGDRIKPPSAAMSAFISALWGSDPYGSPALIEIDA
jgi:hypothetical protein